MLHNISVSLSLSPPIDVYIYRVRRLFCPIKQYIYMHVRFFFLVGGGLGL